MLRLELEPIRPAIETLVLNQTGFDRGRRDWRKHQWLRRRRVRRGIGAFVGLAVYAAFYYSGKASAKAELANAVATEVRVYAEIGADEAKIKVEGAARLKKFDAYLLLHLIRGGSSLS